MDQVVEVAVGQGLKTQFLKLRHQNRSALAKMLKSALQEIGNQQMVELVAWLRRLDGRDEVRMPRSPKRTSNSKASVSALFPFLLSTPLSTSLPMMKDQNDKIRCEIFIFDFFF